MVLDAAHGGDDSGGRLNGVAVEKTVTLALSVRLRSLLTARGFQVATTREGNVNLGSDARAQIANHAVSGVSAGSGAACLSLHASETGSGIHIFVSSLEPVTPTRFVAWKTAQAAHVRQSLKLAGVVNSAFAHAAEAGGSDAGPIPSTVARASLPGVDSMACPAVAIEIAPMREADGKVTAEVTDPDYQTRIVEALAAALLEWKTDQGGDAGLDGVGGGRQP